MEIEGYPAQTARLAYRESQRPDLAIDLADLLSALAGPEIAASATTELSTRTNQVINEWETRTVIQLDEALSRLASFSGSQLDGFRSIFREANIELDDVLRLESSSAFAWASVARASVLALFDTIVDSGNESFSGSEWAKVCSSLLDTDRFRRATGIEESDHDVILENAALAFFASPPSSADLVYRDRLVRLEWTDDSIHVAHRRVEALMTEQHGNVEIRPIDGLVVSSHADELEVNFGALSGRFQHATAWSKGDASLVVTGGEFAIVDNAGDSLDLGASGWLLHTDAAQDRTA